MITAQNAAQAVASVVSALTVPPASKKPPVTAMTISGWTMKPGTSARSIQLKERAVGVLQRAEREDRQRQAHQQERHEVIGADAVAEHEHHAGHRGAGGDAEAEAQQAASRQEAAQAVEIAAGAVFRNEALRRIGDAERAQHAEEADPGPGIDVDAELEAAHPACQQDLAHDT